MNANFESHSISRRSFLKASGVVGAASILAACGGSSSSTAASTSGAASGAAALLPAPPVLPPVQLMFYFFCLHKLTNKKQKSICFVQTYSLLSLQNTDL